MPALNKPTGWKPEEPSHEWSPAQGLGRAAAAGLITAIVLVMFTGLVAALAPLIVLNGYVRAAGAFLITLILLARVQRVAGMAGWPCTALAVGLALLVLLSHHVCFALFGVQLRDGVLRGAVWLSPATLLVANYLALVGVGFGAVLGHRGHALLDAVVDILMTNPLTGRRQ
jgi:hypothetical protein